MSFFDKIKDVTYDYSSEQFLHRGSNEMFVASIVEIRTLNKDVPDSECTLTNHALRLVCIGQQIRMCASCMNKSVNDYFIRTEFRYNQTVISVDGHRQSA